MKVPTLGSARCAGWHFHWDGEGSGDDDAMPQFFAVVGLPTTPRRKRHLPILDSIRLFCYCWDGRRFNHRILHLRMNRIFAFGAIFWLDSASLTRLPRALRLTSKTDNPTTHMHSRMHSIMQLYVAHANSPRRNRIESCQLHDIMTREPNKEPPVGHRSCIPPPVYLRIESRNALRHRRGMFDAPLHPTFCLRRPHNLFSSQQTGK